MNAVDASNQPPPLETMEKRAQGATMEGHLPVGKPLRSVQPLPMPLISPQEGPKPVLDEQSLHREVAMTRAGITGTGVIVDTIA